MADRAPLDRAFAAPTGPQTLRLEALDATGAVVGTFEQSLQPAEEGARVVATAASGTLDDAEAPDAADLASPAAFALGDRPAYLDPRGQDGYTFSLLPDTTLAGRPVRVVEARVRPGFADAETVQRARLYLDGRRLVGFDVERATRSLLFRETSRVRAFAQPAGEALEPRLVTVQTETRAPLAPARRFRLVRRFG